MFKNTVLKANVDTRKWIKSAAIRAVKTMAQTAVALIPGSNNDTTGRLGNSLGTAALSGVVSLLTSVAGIPECEEE